MSSSIIAADTEVHFTFPGQSIKPFIEPNGMFNDRVLTQLASQLTTLAAATASGPASSRSTATQQTDQ